jgi:hypothetical protein
VTRVFVLRFAKDVVSTPLYFSPLEGQLAFTPELLKAFGVKSRSDAEALRLDILSQVKKVMPDLYDKLSEHLEAEEHVFGDNLQ